MFRVWVYMGPTINYELIFTKLSRIPSLTASGGGYNKITRKSRNKNWSVPGQQNFHPDIRQDKTKSLIAIINYLRICLQHWFIDSPIAYSVNTSLNILCFKLNRFLENQLSFSIFKNLQEMVENGKNKSVIKLFK